MQYQDGPLFISVMERCALPWSILGNKGAKQKERKEDIEDILTLKCWASIDKGHMVSSKKTTGIAD